MKLQETQNSAVIPAKAGIQSVRQSLRTHFKSWIPAFAGMTIQMVAA